MKAWKHFCTITYHRWLVMRGCFAMGLYWQGLVHDLSKYSPTEFLVGCKYYAGYRSPNDFERKAIGYSSAWLHHKGRNKHHFEYWVDYIVDADNEKVRMGGIRMPEKYVAEMFADRIAASKVYQKDAYTDRSPLEYFERGQKHGARFMHEETEALLQSMLTMLAEKGEKETFTYIKKHILKK